MGQEQLFIEVYFLSAPIFSEIFQADEEEAKMCPKYFPFLFPTYFDSTL